MITERRFEGGHLVETEDWENGDGSWLYDRRNNVSTIGWRTGERGPYGTFRIISVYLTHDLHH